MVDSLAGRLVSNELWAIVEPLVPPFTHRLQGDGTAPVDARAVFTAIVYVLTSGCAWWMLTTGFGVDYRTAHRRFGQWTRRAVAAHPRRGPGRTRGAR